MSYDNNMTGILSKNDRKESDKHPDIKGQCEIDGVQYWISGWRKERKDGSGGFYSLKFNPKEQQQAKPAKTQAKAKPEPEYEDDIPF